MKKIIATAIVLAFSMANAQVSISLAPNFRNNSIVEVTNIHFSGILLNYFME